MERHNEGDERVRYVARGDFRDVELLCAEQTPRTWTVMGSSFAFAMLRTWKGHVDYRRRRLAVGPGQVFCNEPGEVFRASPSAAIGAFDVVQVATSAFENHCRAEGMRTSPHFGAIVVEGGHQLGRALTAMQVALTSGASSLELESRLAVLVTAAMRDVVEPVPRPSTRLPARVAVERLRELLDSTEGPRVRLSDFARTQGVSQFQLLRGFKRMYGLPPHAYDVTARTARAREMIRLGASVSTAAAAQDFTDQSHLARHFRRIYRVSPGDYARQCNR